MARRPAAPDDPAPGDPGAPRADVRVLARLAPFLGRYRWRIAGAVVALFVAAVTVLLIGQALRHLVDDGFARGDGALLDRAFAGLLAVTLVLAAASWARSYLVASTGERVIADLRRAVFDHVVGIEPAAFETTRTGDVVTRLVADTTLLQSVVGSALSMALRNVLLLGGGAALLVATSPRLAGFVALVVPLVILPVLVIGRRVRRLSRAGQERLGEVGGHLDESFANLRTVQAFGHEDEDRRRFAALVEDTWHAALAHVRARATLASLVIALAFGAVAAILWVGGRDVLAGTLSGGDLAAFVFYAVIVASAAGALSEVAGELQRAAGAAERLFEMLALRPAIAAPAVPTAMPRPVRGRVAFDAVTFAYPARPERPALDTLSFAVAPGERVALVGPSGAGKTTVFELLLRLRDPQAGRVTLDGIDARTLDPRALRGAFALVPQEPAIFSGTLAENIRYGRPDAGDADVAAAAEAAAVTEFATKLPDGLATIVGERGVRLSGGQRQRVAIARAILRDAPVLLLDEATSALDAESERAVQVALARLMQGRTSLVIAHRLATGSGADRILVLDEGRLVAQGKHAELVAQGGLYARLAALQFKAEAAA